MNASTRGRRQPDTQQAMQRLISEIRLALPFDLPEATLCAGPCTGCPKKLLAFLESELDDWDNRLRHGEEPRLGDLSKLARTARKIHKVMERNRLL